MLTQGKRRNRWVAQGRWLWWGAGFILVSNLVIGLLTLDIVPFREPGPCPATSSTCGVVITSPLPLMPLAQFFQAFPWLFVGLCLW